MNQVIAEEIVDFNNNSDGLDKVESISNIPLEEEEEFFDAVSKQDWLTKQIANFNIPLSIFHYKDYGSDFFTSWYNISSEILKEINRACPEKKVLNLALSVLMLPYIAFTALGLVIYSRLNSKTQEGVGEDKAKKGKTGVPKRLAYGILAAIVILVNIAVLVALIIPATLALATFYLLNRKLSHSLVAAFKINMGQYSNKHQNIEVSFHEMEVSESRIEYDMEIKFPPQFKKLLRDLCENENNKWFSVTRDPERNIILKLSTNINLKNGLKPLRNEINDVLTTSIKELAKAMEELMKLEKKDITHDKMKSLLNEFRLKAVSSIDSKLTTHLIENAYQVAFIQAIKFAQKRKKDFSLEDALRDILVKQELESQGKELPTEREMIIKDLKDLKELKIKESLNLTDEDDRLESLMKVGDIDDISDDVLPVFKAKWELLKEEGKITKKTMIDIYGEMYSQETRKAITNAKGLIAESKEKGGHKYQDIKEKLEAMHPKIYQAWNNNNSVSNDLKRKLEDIFKFEPTDQYIYQKLIKSRIRKAKVMLSHSDVPINIKQSLLYAFRDLNVNVCSYHEVNLLLEKMHSEVAQCRILELLKKQDKSIKNIEDNISMLFNREDEKFLVNKIVSYRKEIEEYLTWPAELKKIIEKQNKDLDVEKNNKEKESSSMELIELCLKNNQKILETLEQLESGKEELLINEKTENDYKEELMSREKIKFAIIEDELLRVFKHETFDEEAVKKLLEKAELGYYLAEKCIKSPVIKMKDNIKHFCQDLFSPLVDRLANLIINNVPKDNESGLWRIWNFLKVGLNYNVIGWLATVNKDNSAEGKVLSVAHDTHKEVETFLQHFRSSYEGVGGFLGNLFSDDGTTFKNDVWPKVEEHLHGMWDRFFKDIEFKIGNKLDEVNVTQQNQRTVITA